MIEFSNIIQVTPISDGSNNVYEFVSDSFTYIPQMNQDESGNCWNCDKTIIIDNPDADSIEFFSIERSSIVTIRCSNRKSFQIGTLEIPARVIISSNINSCSLTIRCKSIRDPLIGVF